MPIDQAEAIVLRTYDFGDQDKIVVFFTREKGVLRGVAKGARKFNNRFGSSLEPMSMVRAFYYEKERKDLVTVSNCDLLESFFEAQNDLKVSCTVGYFAELIEEFSPSRSKDDVLYRLLLSVLRCLAAKGDPAFLALYFEAWFLRINGLLPDLVRCKKCRKPLSGSGLAVSEKRRGLLRRMRSGQEGRGPAGDRPFPEVGSRQPSVRYLSPAVRSGKPGRGQPGPAGDDHLPSGERTEDPPLSKKRDLKSGFFKLCSAGPCLRNHRSSPRPGLSCRPCRRNFRS